MKKILYPLPLLLVTIISQAQETDHTVMYAQQNEEIFRTVSIIVTVMLFMFFIVTVLKMFFENRLKHKIVDKGVSDTTAASILQTTPRNDRNMNIKWFAILAGIGAGLMIVNYTQPLGIHSIATMAFSIAASFLGYYFFTKNNAA